MTTRIRKRWRVLWAALTQPWHEHTCTTCHTQWSCLGAHCRLLWSDDECPDCIDRALAKQHQEAVDFTMRQRRRVF